MEAPRIIQKQGSTVLEDNAGWTEYHPQNNPDGNFFVLQLGFNHCDIERRGTIPFGGNREVPFPETRPSVEDSINGYFNPIVLIRNRPNVQLNLYEFAVRAPASHLEADSTASPDWIQRSLTEVGLSYNNFETNNWYNLGYNTALSFINYEERTGNIYTYDIPLGENNYYLRVQLMIEIPYDLPRSEQPPVCS